MRAIFIINIGKEILNKHLKRQCNYSHSICMRNKNSIKQLPISWKYKKDRFILELLIGGGGGKYMEIDAVIKLEALDDHKTKVRLSINYHWGDILIISIVNIALLFLIIDSIVTMVYSSDNIKITQTDIMFLLSFLTMTGGFRYILHYYGKNIKKYFEEILKNIKNLTIASTG